MAKTPPHAVGSPDRLKVGSEDGGEDGPWPNAALLLIGHGSSRNPSSALPTLLHSETLRNRAIFGAVHAGFLKQPPFATEVIDTIASPDIYIVPNMICKGHVTTGIIPKKLGLYGPLTVRHGPTGPRRLHLCPPVGADSHVISATGETIRAIVAKHHLVAKDTCIIMVGHGSGKSRQSYDQTQAAVAVLTNFVIPAHIRAAFLEEPPFIRNWRAITPAPNLIVVPFLMAGGQHGALDIPQCLELPPDDDALKDLEKGTRSVAGPYANEGRRIWYLRPIGLEPIIADVVIQRVRDAISMGGDR
ncbi:CbiX/SirB N-terminal domain-containing protein [Varunaivibrio sulfuroxidans]|uniref:Sirohydrochlorin cobaltochelatase n=1 Tax=Varunaivibrio sulfuroxidans TaxID=1773489 RepID=A0A4R3J4Z4_9PROT|nr:CbiX/SirB N-terminal domain-containing protein [Varunaivibrio sulfuroxidans]TCS60332.1 sirohydrochlorin cobaltochelatase [Varunaivibrio sulfuroxidans]WES30981.1 CbiX/SirB N-terminal domain-containing protein [Varunaivibrio sulfuroxidans]